MKLKHETISLLLALGTLETVRLMVRLALRESDRATREKLLRWARQDAAAYRRQVGRWFHLSRQLALVRMGAAGAVM